MQTVRFGCHGMNGHQIIGAFPHLEGAELTAVSGINDDVYAKLVERLPGVTRYDTVDELIADGDVDAVSLCSARRDEQAGHIMAAVRAGKHVLAEKPLATSLDQLAELEAVLAGASVHAVAMLGMSYYPPMRKMREIVASGRLGTVVHVYSMKSYPYNDSRPQDRGVDGGQICQAGIHAIDFMRYVTGLEIEEAFAWDTGLGNPKDGDLQMAASTLFRFKGGAVGTLLTNYLNPKSTGYWGNDQLRVHGTKGMVEAVDGFTRAKFSPLEGEEEPIETGRGEGHAQTQDFVNFLTGKTDKLHHGLADSLTCTRVVLTAQRSAETGKPERV